MKIMKETTAAPGELRASRPLEIVQVDHTTADIFVLDEETQAPIRRPWLTLAMDVFSRIRAIRSRRSAKRCRPSFCRKLSEGVRYASPIQPATGQEFQNGFAAGAVVCIRSHFYRLGLRRIGINDLRHRVKANLGVDCER